MTIHDRLENKWREFCLACFGANLPKQQYMDLRCTFMSGAVGLFAILKQLPEDASGAEQIMSEVQAELLTFGADVKAGRA